MVKSLEGIARKRGIGPLLADRRSQIIVHGILRSEHVVKLRHLLQLISAGALDADLALHGFHIDRRYRQRHSMCANTEESPDFKNYEEYSIMADDEVVYLPDILVLLVDHFVPEKLADAMALGHGDDIDCNDVDALSDRREVRQKQQHPRQEHRVSKLERNFHRVLLRLMMLIADAERGYTPIP